MMKLATALAVLAVAGVLFSTYRHRMPVALVIVLASFCVQPSLFDLDPVQNAVVHPGIAPWTPRVYLATVLVLAAAVLVKRRPMTQRRPEMALVFVVLLFIGCATVWDGTTLQWAGVMQFGLAAVAWVAGSRLGWWLERDAVGDRWIVGGVVVLIGLQLLICLLQVTGTFLDVEASDQGFERARGTFGHAGDLGKVLVALMALLLPWTLLPRPWTRRAAYTGIALGMLVLGMSVSRSNLIAAVVMLLAWAALTSGRRYGARTVAVVVVAMVVSVPFVASIVQRFELDPNGGSRPELTAAALAQIGRSPLFGTGPNSYVDVVAAYDRATASGLPVHNAFLLVAAELGVILTALALVALIHVIATVRQRRLQLGSQAIFANAFLAIVPAFVLIGATGWGILKGTILGVWALVGSMLFHRAFMADGELREPPSADAGAAIPQPHDAAYHGARR